MCRRVRGRALREQRERVRGGQEYLRARRVLRHVRELRVRLPARVHGRALPPGEGYCTEGVDETSSIGRLHRREMSSKLSDDYVYRSVSVFTDVGVRGGPVRRGRRVRGGGGRVRVPLRVRARAGAAAVHAAAAAARRRAAARLLRRPRLPDQLAL